jgi:tetratricopeptide (TPR) repeat protein
VEHDLLVCACANPQAQRELELGLSEHMARAFSRQNNFAASIGYYDKAIIHCEAAGDFARQGRCLCNKADLHVALGQRDAAKLSFEEVKRLAMLDGPFELYSKSCTGLSVLARLGGRMKEATELAQEAVTAAGLMLDGDYARHRDEATAIFALIACLNVDAASFDEGLLKRLATLGVAIDADAREGGSTVSIRTADLWGKRHATMGRYVEAVVAFKSVVQMATEPRFSQMENVQTLAARAAFQIIIYS